jgi:hypothetical protein
VVLSGRVWDPGALAPVQGIGLDLVDDRSGDIIARTESGPEGAYSLGGPGVVQNGEPPRFRLEVHLPRDHVFAIGYATPTPFPARAPGARHDVLLVGP